MPKRSLICDSMEAPCYALKQDTAFLPFPNIDIRVMNSLYLRFQSNPLMNL